MTSINDNAVAMSHAESWLGNIGLDCRRTPRIKIRNKANRPPAGVVRNLLQSKGFSQHEVERRMKSWEECPHAYNPLTDILTFQ